MNNRSAILLAVGVGSTGLVLGLLLSRANAKIVADEARAAESTAALANASRDNAVVQEPPVLEAPNGRVPAMAERPIPQDPAATTPTTAEAMAPKSDPTDPRDLSEATLDEMNRKRDAIQKELNEKSQPILFQRFDDNLAEHVSDEHKYSGTQADEKAIYAVKMIPGQGTWRTELSRDGYEDLFALKDETLRLGRLIDEKIVAEYLEKRAKAQAGQPR